MLKRIRAGRAGGPVVLPGPLPNASVGKARAGSACLPFPRSELACRWGGYPLERRLLRTRQPNNEAESSRHAQARTLLRLTTRKEAKKKSHTRGSNPQPPD